MYRTFHSDFLKRRKEWFLTYGSAHTAMWWIPEGHIPTMQEAVDKLSFLQTNGPSPNSFDFRHKFPAPLVS